nr:hypothetical protein [Tanacetum cinerariifolium]
MYLDTYQKATEISQSSRLTTLIADETIHEERGDRVERAATIAASLDAGHDNGNINRAQSTAMPNVPFPQRIGSGGSYRCQEAMGDTISQTRSERVSTPSYDSPLLRVNTPGSDEETIKLKELMDLYTKLSNKEDASNKGRNITDFDQNEGIYLFKRMQRLKGVTTAGVSVSTAEPSTHPPTITSIEDEDLIIGQTLMKIRSERSKVKSKEKSSVTATRPIRGVIIKEASETTTRLTLPPQQQLDPTDKEEEERMARKKEEDANIAYWDDFQAMMDADHELAERLQAEEQGELTIKEMSKLFVKLINERKKHFARLGAEKKRRKLPTKDQKRNQMYTYLKNMAGFTHKVVEDSGKKAESDGKEVVSKKRTRKGLDEERVKR